MAKNQSEADSEKQKKEKQDSESRKYQNQVGYDEHGLTRKEIMEARGMK